MSRRSKLTDEEQMAAVREYLEGKGCYAAIAKKYEISCGRFRELVVRAKTDGIESVKIRCKNKKYSTETKLKVEYLEGSCSQTEIYAKYHITQCTVFKVWILCYNRGKEFKERTRSERGITMNKGRRITLKERVEIVAFCIENGKDYGLAMEKYKVSYQQIYSWVRKYEAKGAEGLTDRRGKIKPEDKLTDAGRLRMENKIL